MRDVFISVPFVGVGFADPAILKRRHIADPYFKRLANHPKVLATPHIAYKAISSARIGNDMMIDNIEAHLLEIR